MSEINNNSTAEELNEVVEEVVDDATVMTVPIDDTLSISGEAADAKAVGDALANKIGRGEALTRVTVNGVQSDSSGNVNITGADIPLSGASGAATIGAAMDAMNQSLSEMEREVETATEQAGAAVKTVNGTQPDENGNVALADSGAVLSVNGVTPDENGNVELDDPWALSNVREDFELSAAQQFSYAAFNVYKRGGIIALSFYLTANENISAGEYIRMPFSCPDELKPVTMQAGGDSGGFYKGVHIEILTDRIELRTAQDISAGTSTWVMITYICADQ